MIWCLLLVQLRHAIAECFLATSTVQLRSRLANTVEQLQSADFAPCTWVAITNSTNEGSLAI